MDEARYGKRDKRGNWKPFKRVEYPPLFIWPAQPLAFLKWLFGYPATSCRGTSSMPRSRSGSGCS